MHQSKIIFLINLYLLFWCQQLFCGIVHWSKHRHNCGESLRLQINQRQNSMLGVGQVKQLVIKIVPGVLSTFS